MNFWSGGDTTRDAFKKHIDEITRIYGYLNALDAGKVSASDVSGLSGSVGNLGTTVSSLSTTVSNLNTALTNHINAANPHPNYTPSVSWSNISSKPNLADLSGNLPMSRVTGNLDASRVANLPSSITDATWGTNGLVKFDLGLIIQWGKSNAHTPSASTYTETFSESFSTACYAVIPTGKFPVSSNDLDIQLVGWNTSGYQVRVTGSTPSLATAYLYYIAIGK